MRVCFMGLGYIGLPTAIITAQAGLDVIGVDINQKIVDTTNQGKLHIIEPMMETMLKDVISAKKFYARTTPVVSDAYLIVVPTPFNSNHQPDISFIEKATRTIIPLLKEGDLYIIESTSPVGTTEKMEKLIFKERPELEGKIYIAYCPERVLPGNIVYELIHNDRVIGGYDQQSTEKAMSFYRHFVKGSLHPTNCKTAELCKLTENSSRDVQIAFANELSIICDKAGIDVWELIELANKHPRVNILRPGCGVGGHCIAVDPYFITSKFPEESKLIATSRKINNYKAEWCADRIKKAIIDFKLKNNKIPHVALMGLTFKPDIDDLRESPAQQIVGNIMQNCHDANLMVSEPNIQAHSIFKLTPYHDAFEQADIVAFLVAHSKFKELPKKQDKIIFDFCGIYHP